MWLNEEVAEAETYMRTVLLDDSSTPSNNRKVMLEKIRLTRESRRLFLSKGEAVSATVFLNKYLRFRDIEYRLQAFCLL